MYAYHLSLRSQQGMVLILVMIFLVLISLIATSAVQNTVLDEKMAGNFQLKNRTFEAAEATLRTAEQYLANNTVADSAFTSDCTGGFCLPNNANPVWSQGSSSWTQAVMPTLTLNYQSADRTGLACWKPCYLIEHVTAPPDTGTSLLVGSSYSAPPTSFEYYRVTSRAMQQTSNQQFKVEVMLQSIYKR